WFAGSDISIMGNNGEPERKIAQVDFLPTKTASIPIGTGAKIHGHLTFGFSNVGQDVIWKEGTVFEVTCRDIFSKAAVASVTLRGRNDPPSYYPGTTYIK
ncbi:MAG: hypothetical protein ACRD72_21700, partial [Candidatus Angelobacter sp.]